MSNEDQPVMTPFALEEDAKKAEDGLKEFHFFASSIADWATTSDERTLPDLIKLMEKFGYRYSLWMVPGRWDSNYEIMWYAPKVEGAKMVGVYDPKKGRAKKTA